MTTLKLGMYKDGEKVKLEAVLRDALASVMDEVGCHIKCSECPQKRLCDDIALCIGYLEGRDEREG